MEPPWLGVLPARLGGERFRLVPQKYWTERAFIHRLQAASVTWSGTRQIHSLLSVLMKTSASGKWNWGKGHRPPIPGESRQLLMGVASYVYLGFCYDLSVPALRWGWDRISVVFKLHLLISVCICDKELEQQSHFALYYFICDSTPMVLSVALSSLREVSQSSAFIVFTYEFRGQRTFENDCRVT